MQSDMFIRKHYGVIIFLVWLYVNQIIFEGSMFVMTHLEDRDFEYFDSMAKKIVEGYLCGEMVEILVTKLGNMYPIFYDKKKEAEEAGEFCFEDVLRKTIECCTNFIEETEADFTDDKKELAYPAVCSDLYYAMIDRYILNQRVILIKNLFNDKLDKKNDEEEEKLHQKIISKPLSVLKRRYDIFAAFDDLIESNAVLSALYSRAKSALVKGTLKDRMKFVLVLLNYKLVTACKIIGMTEKLVDDRNGVIDEFNRMLNEVRDETKQYTKRLEEIRSVMEF